MTICHYNVTNSIKIFLYTKYWMRVILGKRDHYEFSLDSIRQIENSN